MFNKDKLFPSSGEAPRRVSPEQASAAHDLGNTITNSWTNLGYAFANSMPGVVEVMNTQPASRETVPAYNASTVGAYSETEADASQTAQTTVAQTSQQTETTPVPAADEASDFLARARSLADTAYQEGNAVNRDDYGQAA